jgi:hypothetical protein
MMSLWKKREFSSVFTTDLGQIEKIFPSLALTPSVKALGADFHFSTNSNA